ncbi:MAG: TRL-like family protein [Candidatus Sumerlaeia bacterium]|nr:TRL-like family protein [Candidatus Sumerlaeia bacterium]
MGSLSRTLLLSAAVGTASILSGCATTIFPGGPTPAGIMFTSVKAPAQGLAVATSPDAGSDKKGESSAIAIFGLFAFGDAGIDTAMRDGGIKKVHHVDHELTHFLYAIFMSHKTIVYGE